MKNKSFTLIELLVVIVIIGILAGVIMISTSSSIDKANVAKVKVFEESVQNNLAANMVSKWTLNGNTNDVWGSNHGIATDISYGQGYDGVNNKAAVFNGSTSLVRASDKQEFDFGSFMSAFIWVKGTVGSIFGQYDTGLNKRAWVIINNGTGMRVVLSGNGTFASGSNKDYRTTVAVFDNNWHFVGFTWSNGTLQLYVDGTKPITTKAHDDLIYAMYNSDINLTIGSQLDNNIPQNLFLGLLSNAKLYNTSLPSSQIKQNYIAGLNSMLSNGNISKEEYNERINELAYEQE